MRPVQNPEHTRWFAEEVKPHDKNLRLYLRRALRTVTDVDDLAQDCYLRLLRAKEKSCIRSTKALLFAIARNAVRDFIHRKSRTDAKPMVENEDSLVLLDDPRDVVETICQQQELAMVHEAINSLPSRCREVILLRKIKGLSQREIAAMLGIAEHTVEALAVKGARRCREYLRARGLTSTHGR
jgi:RNA polymerase sigma factor (sigma-70 family)